MSKKEKNKNAKDENFLDYIPVKNINWDSDSKTGHVYLIKEKTKNRLLKKIIDWVGKNQHFHIHLDETGSAVWRAIDGERSVNDIANLLKETYGEEFKQPEQRVSYFLGMMMKSDFVQLLKKTSN